MVADSVVVFETLFDAPYWPEYAEIGLA